MGKQCEIFGSEHRRDSRGRTALVRRLVRVFLPAELTVHLSGLGDLVLRPVVVETDVAWMGSLHRGCEGVRLECAGTEALLLVEKGFARHTVNALLGHAPAISDGPLSRIERGLFHGVLAALCARLGLISTVGLCSEERQTPDSGLIVIEAFVELRGGAGRAWLCASAEFLAQILATQAPASKDPSAMVYLELARTLVPVAQLAAATAGDGLVFDEVAALPATDPWPIRIRNGGAAVSASLRPDGILADGDVDDLGIITQAERRSARIHTPADPAKFSPGSTDTVEIVAELGRFQGVSLARLLGGAPLDWVRGNPILLRLADTPWAEGEITAHDDAFAVRITRKLAG
jgi:hypothetical protein